MSAKKIKWRPRTGIDWYRNPRASVFHAYVAGPGTGDGPLCGRTVLDGAAHPSIHVGDEHCSFCRALLPG